MIESRTGHPLLGVEAISFDFDDTLVNEEFSTRRRWRATLREFSHLAPGRRLELEFFKAFDEKGPSYKRHVNDALERLGADPKWVGPIVSRFLATRAEESRLPGALPLLRYLDRRSYKIAIITNGERRLQESRIRTAGLAPYVDHIVYGDLDKKPAVAGFQDVLAKFKLRSASALLHVGDSLSDDVGGCLAAGARACWLNRDHERRPPAGDVLVIRSMTELLHRFMTMTPPVERE